jgi:hypothetical protein
MAWRPSARVCERTLTPSPPLRRSDGWCGHGPPHTVDITATAVGQASRLDTRLDPREGESRLLAFTPDVEQPSTGEPTGSVTTPSGANAAPRPERNLWTHTEEVESSD